LNKSIIFIFIANNFKYAIITKMIECPVCTGTMNATQLSCQNCHIQLGGDFSLPRLARLPPEQQKFIEALVLAGGNLKELALALDMSYPTLRKRLDALIETLKTLQEEDRKKIGIILERMETGDLPAAQGLRKIKEINGEL
jgi:hypothetical protein